MNLPGYSNAYKDFSSALFDCNLYRLRRKASAT